jgi:multidrug efflux pump subunit AcrA (membrane-fusion protein)
MKKLIVVLAVLMLSIVVYAASKEAWVASPYKGVVELKVQLGQQVKKDQLLFEVNQNILEVDKKSSEVTVKFLKIVMAGGEKLYEKQSISQDVYQQCQRDLAIEKNILKTVEAQIAASKLHAPFDGTVTKIIRYDGSGLGDNDDELQVTEGEVKVNTANRVGLVCTRWEGILTLKVDQGQKVKKGQLLYTINTADIEAQIAEAEAKAKYMKITFERQKELYGTTAVHATSLYKFLLSKDDLNKQVGEVEKLKIKLKQCSGYAPFDGTVTKIYRYTGSGNGAGKPVMDITASK